MQQRFVALALALNLSFALFLIVGGVMGFVKAGSIASLLGGLMMGSLLFILTLRRTLIANIATLLVIAFSTGVFFIRFSRDTTKWFPAGIGALTGASLLAMNLTLVLLKSPIKNI